ncbi:hypothetical protein [Hymenobacter edaphi]|uniref:hypothetical protein n=1 Tax=Hymenobacter edaphi TaxID=2211146 RepID=UPI001A9E6E5F|nr:hypothetical protein [Hymenobacter edaphi]
MNDIPRNKNTEHQFTAFVDYHLSFPRYLGSYKRSFDILMKDVLDSGYHVDSVAYPLLFIARHCIELGLKTNIRYFAKYSGKDDFTVAGTHDLETLFRAFKMHVYESIVKLSEKHGIKVEKEDKKAFDELCLEVESLKDVFHALDKNSDAFRYPVDKQQNPSFKEGVKLNVLDVNELLEKSMILFFHTSDVFAKYTDYADMIDKMYEDTMREQYEQGMQF